MLALNLPPGARVWVEIGHDVAWTGETHMLASVVDKLSSANWQRGGGKGARPTPIPRPEELAERRDSRGYHLDQAQRFLERRALQASENGDAPTEDT